MDDPELDYLLDRFSKMERIHKLPVHELRRQMDRLAERFPTAPEASITPVQLGNVRAEQTTAGEGPVVLYLHGGGYIAGSPRSHRHLTDRLAHDISGTVFSLDYRLAPEHPFPAAIEDAIAAYEELATKGPITAIAGDSAGGGLALSLLISLQEKRSQMPRCAVAISPWLSVRPANVTYESFAEQDYFLSKEGADYLARQYAPPELHQHPLVSPLNCKSVDFPPILIQVAANEVLVGDVYDLVDRLRASNADVELDAWDNVFHVWHLYWPMLKKGREAIRKMSAFILSHS